MPRVKVARTTDIGSGQGRVVEAQQRTVAVFDVAGSYHAIDNSCPHRGGPLGEGNLDGRIVSCPWHGRRWDVTTGGSANNPAVRVACFPVVVAEDEIFVDMP